MPANDWKERFLGRLNRLPQKGFEAFAIRLLAADGFHDVVVDHRKDGNLVGGNGVLRACLFGYGLRFLFVRNLPVTGLHVQILEKNVRSPGDRRLLVTTGAIDGNVRNLCQSRSSSYIDLVDGDMLCEACKRSRIGLKVTPPTDEKVEPDLGDFGGKRSSRVHGSSLYCHAWQFMASEVYKDSRRDLCGEIYNSGILGERTILGKRKEDLSASTQKHNSYCEITVGEPPNPIVWLVNHCLSNDEKIKILLKVAGYAFRREDNSKSDSNFQYVVNICEQIKNIG